MNQEKIGRFISERRKEVGLTQKEFAEKLGVTDKTVSRWENGHYLPDVSLFKEICVLLEIELTELLQGEQKSFEDKKGVEKTIMDIIDISSMEKRKKVKRIVRISTFVIIALFILIGVIYGSYQHRLDKLKKEIAFYSKEQEAYLSFPYRYAFIKKEDGWVCYLNIEYAQEEPSYYGFGCANIKYKYLEGFNQKVEGDESERFYSYESSFGYPELLNNEKYNKEIRMIGAYLLEKKIAREITLQDLEDLTIQYISKEDLILLYNQAITSDLVKKKGNYPNILSTYVNESSILKSKKWSHKEEDFQFVLGYLSYGGYIYDVNIELKMGDIYLSGLVTEGKATEEQKEVYETIKSIEKKILEEQNFRNALQIASLSDVLYPLQENLYYIEVDNTDELTEFYSWAW